MIKSLKSFYVALVVFKSRLQYRLRHLLKTTTLKGVKLIINDDEVLSKDALLSIFQGGYEDKENEILKDHLAANDIVIELGTSVGFNAISIAKLNGGKILSYEANPRLLSLIKKNQQLNRVSFEVRNKVLVTNKEASSKIAFNIAENPCMSSSKRFVLKEQVMKEVLEVETEYAGEVFDSLLPTFLVVDIEGGEEDFFRNVDLIAQSTIQKILLEVHPEIIGEEACKVIVNDLLQAGFAIASKSDDKTVLFFTRNSKHPG